MAWRIEDFKCKNCGHVQELLFDTKKDEGKSFEELGLICEKCNSSKWERTISAGTGDKTHISWKKWRMNLND